MLPLTVQLVLHITAVLFLTISFSFSLIRSNSSLQSELLAKSYLGRVFRSTSSKTYSPSISCLTSSNSFFLFSYSFSISLTDLINLSLLADNSFISLSLIFMIFSISSNLSDSSFLLLSSSSISFMSFLYKSKHLIFLSLSLLKSFIIFSLFSFIFSISFLKFLTSSLKSFIIFSLFLFNFSISFLKSLDSSLSSLLFDINQSFSSSRLRLTLFNSATSLFNFSTSLFNFPILSNPNILITPLNLFYT